MHEKTVKGILSAKNGMNIYRGCSHGCIYCDSRSKCYAMDHAFEDIEVKINAPELLEDALKRKRSKCMIGTGSMSDPYLHLEEKLRLTRQCLEIIVRYGFGLSILTKSSRILRDLDLLKKINEQAKCVVQMTLTTYDETLCRILEPNVSGTRERFETLMTLRENGIPAVVWIDPILPFITDTAKNLRGILGFCGDTGVRGIICFGMGVTLREGDREYFYSKLDEHFPGMKSRYIRAFGNAYECLSSDNEALMRILADFCKERGILYNPGAVFSYLHAYEEKRRTEQLSLL